jgi:adenylate kinase
MKIIFLGGQGSGKSTQAKMLAQELGLPYIEMGQLLREKSKEEDTEAGEVRQALEIGNLVPDSIAVKILQERVAQNDCQAGYVLDGYPRNYAQLEGLPDDIDLVFYVKVADNEAISRLIKRGREDDSLDVITRRLELYHKETEPLLAYFNQENKLQEVGGERSIEEIHEDIKKRLSHGVAQESR